jgi:uncharacterized SAM-binding protein YcdF (DUF218 family)
MGTLFFIVSKVVWTLISPSTWLILFPAIAVWLRSRSRKVASKFFVIISIAYWTAIGFFPVGQWLVRPLENYASTPSADIEPDGVIVLGGAWLSARSTHWGQWELNHAAEREIAFLLLAKRFPNAQLVFTGGSGKLTDQTNKEATFAAELYQDFGIDPARLTLESQSRNTAENVEFSQSLISPKPNETWFMITSAYHMPRAVGVFCAEQWSVIPYPVDHISDKFNLRPRWALAAHLWELERVTHEWIGLFAYRLLGKTKELFPSSC